MKLMACTFLSLALCAASAQFVQVGPVDPNYCANIAVKPNLHVPSLVKLKGRILDQTGAEFRNGAVELRRFNSDKLQTTIAKARTDSKGYFDLGEVKPDSYRLLVSTGEFKPPTEMWCNSDAQCFLNIKLQGSSTEHPDSQCPIK